MSTDKPGSIDGNYGAGKGLPAPRRWTTRSVGLVLPVGALVVAAGVSLYWLTHRPKAQRRPPEPRAILVEVERVRRANQPVVIRALGTVVPARTIQLASLVSGKIIPPVSLQFVPGGHVQADKPILRIDPRDYEAVVKQRAGDLAKARSDLEVEIGRQSVARRESQLLGDAVKQEDEDLVLRKPQLAMAEAAEAAAQATLAKAQLDLKRTTVTTPFNAMVQSRSVNLGSHVAVGSPLASLVGTDEYWVQVSLPVDQLKRIDIPEFNSKHGSTVRVYHEAAWGPGVFRDGTVHRLMSDLEPQGRLAQLLVKVEDPLGLKVAPEKRHPLILGAHVRVEIRGRDLQNVVRLARTALRDGDRVWVMNPDKTLAVCPVDVVWSGNDDVYVGKGLTDGDMLITSDLGAPVRGMALRTSDASKSAPAGQGRASQPSQRPEGRL